MLDRHTATARITRQMKSAEIAVSDALCATLALMHSAALAQREVGGPQSKSHVALLSMGKIVEGLVAAQGEALRTHGRFAIISREVNGPEEPTCPDEDFFATSEVQKSVSSARR